MDEDYFSLCEALETRGFKRIHKEEIRDAVHHMARLHSFDSAMLWLEQLPAWDGVKRVGTFLVDYCGTDNTPYSRAVSRYLWSALAGRVLEPGVKADMTPILEGRQGVGKSSLVMALAPTPECFCSISFSEDEDKIARKMRGKMVAEIPELHGLRTRELEFIKSFTSRQDEMWVPKFKEYTTTYPRRLIFIGTTNDTDLLSDSTGERRWLPVHVEKCDVEALTRDRNQLWAEAREVFKEGGVDWSAERLSADAHAAFRIEHPWREIIADWLDDADANPMQKGYVTMQEVLREALHLDTRNMKGVEGRLVGGIMISLGYERTVRWVAGKSLRVWAKEGGKNVDDLIG